jgi:hypothetical protein
VDDWERVVAIFEGHEAKQQQLAILIGQNCQELQSATTDKKGKLTLLWEAKSELF